MVVYEGPSLIDGKPIVAIVTGLDSKSHNSKTGDMPQVWILRSDIHPTEALRTGEDYSICGDCPHRPQELGDDALRKFSRTCYVNTMSFNAVYEKYACTGRYAPGGKFEKHAGYPVANLEEFSEELAGLHVRIGAYGDPAAVPLSVWDTILKHCKSTGYTHQWRTCDPGYAQYCMASCDTPLDVLLSTAKGYRTFYVQNISTFDQAEHNIDGIKLAHCPASKEKGKSTTCSKCMACNGTRFGQKSNITIMIH